MAGQRPILTPETVTSARDPVVREVFGVTATFSTLSTAQQTVVTQEINSAFMEVVARGKWFANIDPTTTDLPTDWNELLRQIAVAKLKRQFRSPADYALHWKAYVEPLQDRIADHYTVSWATAIPLASDLADYRSVRLAAAAVLIRQRHPVFWPLADIDRVVHDEFVRLWYSKWWNFRRRPSKLTLKTDGTIVSAGDLPFAGLASKYFVVEGSGGRSRCTWVDSTRAAQIACAYDGETGKPLYFTDSFSGGRPTIALYPIPDEEYTAFAVIYAGARDPSPAKVDGIRDLPPPFRTHLRDRVIATILSQAGREDTDAGRWVQRVEHDFNLHCGQYDDGGPAHSTAGPHHIGRTLGALVSYDGTGNLSPLG